MTIDELTIQQVSVKKQLSEHWHDCLDAQLHGHNKKRHETVNAAYDGLKGLQGASKTAVLTEIRTLFEELDAINGEADGCLLETDERELLVPAIIQAAVSVGLKASEFKDDDPTMEFRNF